MAAATIAVGVLVAMTAVVPAQGAERGPVLDAQGCRSIPVPADAPLRSAEARERWGVDGTGVTVGIISNSFDTSAEPDAAADVRAGVLPGPGNPCGRTTAVRVLIESAVPQDDEGRAMAQLVHGIAPGAQLMFAAAGGMSEGDAAYVTAIQTLVEAGADIIVDDIPGNDEPAFQRGAIGWAVEAATDAGVLYVTAAGNDGLVGAPGQPSAGYPIGAWATDAYRPTACPEPVAALYPEGSVDCMDFDAGPDVDPLQSIVLAPGALILPRLQWSDPFGGVTTALEHVTVTAEGAQPPRAMQRPDRPKVEGAASNFTGEPAEQEFAIVRRLDRGAPGAPAVRWVLQSIGFPSILHLEHFRPGGKDTAGSTIIGHESDPAALSVAAVHVDTLTAETFSSMGPARFDFAPVRADGTPAARLAEPLLIPGPAVAGVQRLPISFVLGRTATFAGTSAAAPTVAAVAALGLDAAPGTTPAALRAALERTADPASARSPYPADVEPTRVVGAGLVDANALVASLIPHPSPTPTPEPRPTGVPAAVPAAEPPAGELAESGIDAAATVWLGAALVGLGLVIRGGKAARRRQIRR